MGSVSGARLQRNAVASVFSRDSGEAFSLMLENYLEAEGLASGEQSMLHEAFSDVYDRGAG